jgi:hypothetical protein
MKIPIILRSLASQDLEREHRTSKDAALQDFLQR